MIQKLELRHWVYSMYILTALMIVIDFQLPGRVLLDEVSDVKIEHQQYYNAARNLHYSYRVITSKHNFYVSEDFVDIVRKNRKVKYSVSRLFKEVNHYEVVGKAESKEMYSLRILSGLIIPLLVIIIMEMAYLNEKKFSILIFVIQVILIGDLIYLMI